MSSIYAQLSDGPFSFKYHDTLGQAPKALAEDLTYVLDMPVDQRPANYVETVRDSWESFETIKQKIYRLIVTDSWKHTRWDHVSKIFRTLADEPCTLDEAVADYVRSLPLALRASIQRPLLTDAEVQEASVAYAQLMERVKSVTG